MTPMIDCTVSNGSEPEHPTILQCLYFMSHQTAVADLIIETDIYGNSIRLHMKRGGIAPRPPGDYPPTGPESTTRSGTAYNAEWYYADHTNPRYWEAANNIHVLLEPWLEKNYLGPKTFLVTLEFGTPEERKEDRRAGSGWKESVERSEDNDSDNSRLCVGKFWDGYKNPGQKRDEEVAIYQKLRPLWGKTVPNFIAFGEVDFFWALFIERIQVIPKGN
jgi:hypothetical protein